MWATETRATDSMGICFSFVAGAQAGSARKDHGRRGLTPIRLVAQVRIKATASDEIGGTPLTNPSESQPTGSEP